MNEYTYIHTISSGTVKQAMGRVPNPTHVAVCSSKLRHADHTRSFPVIILILYRKLSCLYKRMCEC